MNYTIDHKSNEQKDRRKSAVITAVVAILAFLIIFFYKFTRLIPQEEVVTTMLINFGDNQNGDGAEEPANQEGSLASDEAVTVPEPVSEPKPQPTPVVKEKIITGNNTKVTAPKSEKPKAKKRPVPKEDLIESIKQKEKKAILDAKKKEQIDLIKAFSKKDIKLATIKEIEANQNTENLAEASTKLNDNLLSESFAKILLNQGKKGMAKEIYEKLALKFPEKKTYFADLIEKLKE